jgi:hypothetical protein
MSENTCRERMRCLSFTSFIELRRVIDAWFPVEGPPHVLAIHEHTII